MGFGRPVLEDPPPKFHEVGGECGTLIKRHFEFFLGIIQNSCLVFRAFNSGSKEEAGASAG